MPVNTGKRREPTSSEIAGHGAYPHVSLRLPKLRALLGHFGCSKAWLDPARYRVRRRRIVNVPAEGRQSAVRVPLTRFPTLVTEGHVHPGIPLRLVPEPCREEVPRSVRRDKRNHLLLSPVSLRMVGAEHARYVWQQSREQLAARPGSPASPVQRAWPARVFNVSGWLGPSTSSTSGSRTQSG